ncbi:MAG: hypothetical protein RQ867_04375 [Mariprofundaceae bacterium]|nr:hypothetical protein [Mariprofundaceae bacterium]
MALSSAMSTITMRIRPSIWLLAVVLALPATLHAVELTGRLSLLGTAARASQGDIGHLNAGGKLLTADQQSLRLMLDDIRSSGEWSVHLRTVRQNFVRYPAGNLHSSDLHSSDLFRYRKLSGDWQNDVSINRTTRSGYEIDRAVYKQRFDQMTVAIGRQPIDWGSGRFWQPLNVFGAFAPTDLDTDFKPGIDAAAFDWYPSAFSSLTAVYVPAPFNQSAIADSGVVYYRRQAGESSEISLLAGTVLGKGMIGGSFESEWHGIGWRVEGLRYRTTRNAVFWIAGIDYQFEDGTLIAAEWYDNSAGAGSEALLAGMQGDQRVVYGLQQHSGRRVLGLAVEKDMTPLLHGGYTLLVSALENSSRKLATSLLHQFSLTYSVSNESDFLVSLLLANGKGVNQQGNPQSEFGHLPAGMTMRLRFYF